MKRNAWGSVTRRGEGVWRLRWPLPPNPDGTRAEGSETFRGTYKEACKRLSEIQLALGEGRQGGIVLSSFWADVYLPEAEEVLAPATLQGYRAVWKANIEPVFGSREMETIKGMEVQRWLTSLSYGAARHAKAVLSAVFGRAHALDYVDDNVMARRYRLPGRETTVRRANEDVLSLDELEQVADGCRGEVWEPAFLLSAFAGARREEACGVRLDELDFVHDETGRLWAVTQVVRGVQRVGGKVVEVKPKTASSRRWLVVPEPWSLRLRAIAEDLRGQGLAWLTDDGMCNPCDPDALARSYKRWFLAHGVRYVPWKNLRNSYATNVHAAGVELPTVAKLLGHSRQQTTYVHYDRPQVPDLIAAVSAANMAASGRNCPQQEGAAVRVRP